MAHFLQAVALTAILCGAARAADFSHREHLGYGLACTECHTQVKSSTRVEDNNLPGAQACLQCHQAVAIPSPRATPLAHFSHEGHTKRLDCLTCHHGMDKSDVSSLANFPRMADCVTCHPQGDMPNGCWQCHAKTMQFKPATHISGFVDAHSRVKHSVEEKASCDVCHGRSFHCAGCH